MKVASSFDWFATHDRAPIKVLVEALEQLETIISYEKEVGYPPIRIKGQKITASKVNIPANVSSQYISALI
jgi:3-phosphoshikimate 1-carboxyvinyltransferase